MFKIITSTAAESVFMHHSVKSLFLKVDSCSKFICLIFNSKFSCTCTRKNEVKAVSMLPPLVKKEFVNN